LWEELERVIRGVATDGGEADEGEAVAVEAGVAPEDA
jgi:hypothetical protein